ncbi:MULTISPECIES: hypothetical protein [Cyclobacteriaceae]|uniref:Uncharacterized protein n=2 Tax=Cyclobacteriaceae TaxID=563798 RepID=A0A8J3D160_9BACT|nr:MULTISPECIES: hypothetical protein [Cyclobacteriaceae]PSK98320.1 hypothetical protein CLV48_11919 [Cecembia rubra]GHB53869.1 hypothetical protein GCM10008106_37690 [Mongoliitalea lutea]
MLTGGIKESISLFFEKLKKGIIKENDKPAIIEATTSIQQANIKTKNFISDNGYLRNEELTKLWLIALEKVVKARIDENLPEYLFHKSRFWGEPKDWLNNPETLRLLPKLIELDKKCEMLLMTLKK